MEVWCEKSEESEIRDCISCHRPGRFSCRRDHVRRLGGRLGWHLYVDGDRRISWPDLAGLGLAGAVMLWNDELG